jgi:pimeloyl-ACP methyl ester carboxylesterase
LALVLALSLAACASLPERYDAAARAAGLERRVVPGERFRHVVYQAASPRRGDVLHIYLEGDGSPLLLRRRLPRADPTPRRPLMPRLMALDPGPAVLLGRPCYHGLAADPTCDPAFWTAARYSSQVVESLAAAARRLMAEGGHRGAVLLGHSGGGTLALLLARRLAGTRAVVAVAANLDTEAWAAHHRLPLLERSLNPATLPPRPDGVPELIVAGGRDRVVPAALIEAAAARRPNARLRLYQAFDHACCWESVWPELLAWAEGAAAGEE